MCNIFNKWNRSYHAATWDYEFNGGVNNSKRATSIDTIKSVLSCIYAGCTYKISYDVNTKLINFTWQSYKRPKFCFIRHNFSEFLCDSNYIEISLKTSEKWDSSSFWLFWLLWCHTPLLWKLRMRSSLTQLEKWDWKVSPLKV